MTDPLRIEMEPVVDRETIEAALDRGHEALTRGALGPLSHLSWPLVRSTLAGAIGDALGPGLLGWLAGGWSAARELHELKDAEGKDGGPALFRLGRHRMEGVLHPVVTISCGGVSLPPVRFDVPVTATLNANSLAVRKGHVVGLGGGECSIAVRIEYDGNDLSGDLPLRTIELPGKFELDPPGIPIP